jgi:hypothetical protein
LPASIIYAQDSHYSKLAEATFKSDVPNKETSEMMIRELKFQRAVQVYLWSLPAVNVWAMKEGFEAKFGAGYDVPAGMDKGLMLKPALPPPIKIWYMPWVI